MRKTEKNVTLIRDCGYLILQFLQFVATFAKL